MSLQLSLLLKIIGWILAGAPFAGFILFSIHMIRGISEDDEMVKGLLSIGFTIFLIGAAILVATYVTDLFTASSGTI